MNKIKLELVVIGVIAVVALAFTVLSLSQQEKCEKQTRLSIEQDPSVSWILHIPDEKVQAEVRQLITDHCIAEIEKGERF